MIAIPLAHVAGIPIEETLALYGPALLLAAGAVSAKLGARVRRRRLCLRRRPAERRPLSEKRAGGGATG